MLTRSNKARSIKFTNAPWHKNDRRREVIVPQEDISSSIGYMLVDHQLLGSDNHDFFALKVSDEAMCNFGIFQGDTVIVRQTGNFNPGDIVVATVDDKNQILRAYPKQQGKIELRLANPEFKTQVFPAAEITIRGVVVALQREY